jgi:hypothetical protein
MTPEGIKQTTLLALSHASLDLDRFREEMHTLDVKITNAAAAMQGMPVAQEPPAQAGTALHEAVERLFKEATDWSKSCSSTSNWFDHSPAAQALKALLKQRGAAAQEPRLTLGRVPTGGPGQYHVYFAAEIAEFRPATRCLWRPERGWNLERDADQVIASFGPMPSVNSVLEMWSQAGRPA